MLSGCVDWLSPVMNEQSGANLQYSELIGNHALTWCIQLPITDLLFAQHTGNRADDDIATPYKFIYYVQSNKKWSTIRQITKLHLQIQGEMHYAINIRWQMTLFNNRQYFTPQLANSPPNRPDSVPEQITKQPRNVPRIFLQSILTWKTMGDGLNTLLYWRRLIMVPISTDSSKRHMRPHKWSRTVCMSIRRIYTSTMFLFRIHISQFMMKITLKAAGMWLIVVTEQWTPVLLDFLRSSWA